MEEQITWEDMMQYTKFPLDEIVGKYWTRDYEGIRCLTVRLNVAVVQEYLLSIGSKGIISFSYSWSHLEIEWMRSSLIQDLGFGKLLQLGVTEKPHSLKAEGLLDILYAIGHLKPNMFAGRLPSFHESR